jgi:hypothetical protein
VSQRRFLKRQKPAAESRGRIKSNPLLSNPTLSIGEDRFTPSRLTAFVFIFICGSRFCDSLAPHEAAAWAKDEGFLAWVEGTGAIIIATELKVRPLSKNTKKANQTQKLSSNPGDTAAMNAGS